MRRWLTLSTLVLAFLLASACGGAGDAPQDPAASPTVPSVESALPLQPDRPVLYAIDPDGGGPRVIYEGRWFIGYALSPGGETIALHDAGHDEHVLYLQDTETGDREEIVRAEWLRLFTWSPDGRWLLLDMIPTPDDQRALHVYSLDEASLTAVQDAPGPSSGVRGWAPDSSAVYVSESSGPASLSRIDLPSLQVAPLDVEFDELALSPDGQWFAVGLFERDEGSSRGITGYTIDVVRIDGSERRTLVELDDTTFVVGGLAWSPDGGRISYALATVPDDGGINSGVHVVDVDSAVSTRISDAPDGVDTSAVWSPAGDALLVTRRVCTQCDGPGSKTVLAPADGSGEVALDGTMRFRFGDAAWSPDGSRFAYGADALYIGAPDGSGERMLTDLEVSSYQSLAWSPDGSGIFFVRIPDLDTTLYAAIPDGSSIAVAGGGALPSPDEHFSVGIDLETGEPFVGAKQGRSGTLRHEDLEHISLSDMVWSPDSAWLAMMPREKGETVVIWGQGDLRSVDTPGRTTAIRWSPQGDRFAYSDRSALWAVDAKSGERELLIEGNFAAFDWSPAGDEMAVLNRESLTIVSVDGSEGRRTVLEPPPSQANPTLSWSPLRWSPDGERLAIADGRSLHVISAATGEIEATIVVFVTGLAWSPDGSLLAYGASGSQGDEVAGGVHILEAATGQSVQLTELAARAHVVRGWLEDGRLLFASEFRL
ncbi:MAG: hypothetical protein J4N26_02470 [Chloroflexi bacterium]|nr:hypothetical protein [Chloroflexota bacterium]